MLRQSSFTRLQRWQEADDETFVRHDTCDVLAKLLGLTDAEVSRIAAFCMARSLECGSDVVEDVGARLAVDARSHWQPDDTFFDLIRDRATINALLAEVAGEAVANANIAEKTKTQKQIVRDCLTGNNGRTKVENWIPGWMRFPAKAIGMTAPQMPQTEEENGESGLADEAGYEAERIAAE